MVAPNENLCVCSFGPYKIHYFPVTYAQEIKCFQHSSVLAVMGMWPQLRGCYVRAKICIVSNTILNTTTSAVFCTLQLLFRGDILQRCCCYMGLASIKKAANVVGDHCIFRQRGGIVL